MFFENLLNNIKYYWSYLFRTKIKTMHSAMATGNLPLLEKFLNKGEDPNSHYKGKTLLSYIVTSEIFTKNIELAENTIKLLKSKNINMNQTDSTNSRTVLHDHCMTTEVSSETVFLLISQQVDPTLKDNQNKTALDHLIDKTTTKGPKSTTVSVENRGNISEAVKLLKLDLRLKKENLSEEKLFRLLYDAIADKNLIIARFLMKKNANLDYTIWRVNKVDHNAALANLTLLQFAAVENDPDRLDMILQIDKERSLKKDHSALPIYVVSNTLGGIPTKQIECFKVLKKYGIKIGFFDPNLSMNLLHYACSNDNIDPMVINYLISIEKVSIDVLDANGRKPVHLLEQKSENDRKCSEHHFNWTHKMGLGFFKDNFQLVLAITSKLLKGESPIVNDTYYNFKCPELIQKSENILDTSEDEIVTNAMGEFFRALKCENGKSFEIYIPNDAPSHQNAFELRAAYLESKKNGEMTKDTPNYKPTDLRVSVTTRLP